MADLVQLPPEFQAELSRLMQQRRMAEAFQARSMQAPQTEVFSGVAAKQSPLGALARILSGRMAGSALGAADEGISGLQRRAADAQSEETRSLMGMTPQARVAAALASRNPAIRKMGADWQKMAADAANAAGKVAGDMGDASGAMKIFGSGQVPGDYQAPPPTPVEFGSHGENPYAIETNRKGEKSVKFGPLRQTTEIRIPGKEADMSLDILKGQLGERQKEAKLALGTLNSNRTAMEALNEGAQAGGTEGVKQAIRKIAQGFGIPNSETAPTETLAMALGNNLLENARRLAPVTENDLKLLQQILGSVNTDPTALQTAFAVYNALAYKSLQDYQRYVGEGAENLKTPYASDMFRTAGIGFEIPESVPGNQIQQMRMLQELKARGGDVSKFAVGGQPLPPDAAFNIGKEKLLPPGTQPPQGKVLSVDQLTPEQKAQLLEMLQKGR